MGCCNDRIIIKSNKIKSVQTNKINLANKSFRSKFFVGEFFLLDKENILLNLDEKIEYINRLNFLLNISDYNNQYKLKKLSDSHTINPSHLNKENHKELYLFMILNIDLSIINNDFTFQRIYNYYQLKVKDLKEFILNGPPQVFRPILWKILIKLESYIEMDERSVDRLERTELNQRLNKKIEIIG